VTRYLVLLFISFVAVCAHAQTQAYKNPTYAFSMQLPPAWQTSEPGLVESDGQKINYALIAQAEHAGIAVTVNDIYANSTNAAGTQPLSRKDIDESWADKEGLASFQKKFEHRMHQAQDFRLIENGVAQIDGVSALFIAYSSAASFGPKGTVPLVTVTYVLTKNGMLFSLTGYSPAEYYQTEKKTLIDSIMSFHVDPLPAAVMEAAPKQRQVSFFRRAFMGIIDNIAGNILLWIGGLAIAAVVAAISGIGSLVRKRRRT
jgi:hypothetical protein